MTLRKQDELGCWLIIAALCLFWAVVGTTAYYWICYHWSIK
jgi:hypothetical protein